MDKTPAWVGITYLVYVALVLGIFFGGTGYAVFVLGQSGWWFVLAAFFGSCSYSPWRWHSIWTGVEVPYRRDFERDTPA